MKPQQSRPACIVLGGSHNALSIARSLGRRGIRVYALNRADAEVRWSRYATWLPLPDARPFEEETLRDFLCGRESDAWRGAVLLAAGDEALKVLADSHAQLAEKFQLDLCNPSAQRCMLDKLATYKAARAAGVPTPKFWVLGSQAQLEQRRDELTFPLIVKPRASHVFQRVFRTKFLVANRYEDLESSVDVVERAGVECILVEKIPGPDSLLASYYTYLDESGAALFDFTKRVLRRSPPNMGLATYHITDHVPELKTPALQLFRQVGLRGLANVEFKCDPRDGVFKLIECNARFTAANCLLSSCGLDLASFVYDRIVGIPTAPLGDYADDMRLWDPLRDAKACLELRRRGELGVLDWLRSVLHRQTFPVFSLRDPLPFVMRLARQQSHRNGSRSVWRRMEQLRLTTAPSRPTMTTNR